MTPTGIDSCDLNFRGRIESSKISFYADALQNFTNAQLFKKLKIPAPALWAKDSRLIP